MKIQNKESFIIYEEFENEVEIKQIYADEKRKGVGTEMLEEVIKYAKSINANKVITYSSTDPETQEFGKFLVASGFVKTNEANGTGNKWELEIKEVKEVEEVKEIKKVKNEKPTIHKLRTKHNKRNKVSKGV
jgi:GNAT superfamily N-acetyltransferase